MQTAAHERVLPLNDQPLVLACLTWFEIPTADIQRARAFYETVLGTPLQDVSHDEPMFMFPTHGGSTSGALVQREHCAPGEQGTVVYLRVTDTLAQVRERVVPAGGAFIGDIVALKHVPGIFCLVRDSEGNRVGLHAQE